MEELLLAAPQSEDMREAFKGIFRIEHNYDLEAADIADGMLWGKQYDAKLSTSDCLAIAEYMYNKSEYISAAKWYRVALSHHIQFDDDIFRNIYGSQREDIRKNYIISRLKAGKADDVQLYLKELSHDPKTQLENTAKPTPSISQLGCRGLYPPRTNLSCRYNFTNTPYSRLAPLKMEIVNENPFIVLYHDILYEHEINSLTNQSITTDGWTDDAEPELEVERICKVSTVQDRKIGRRVEQMSGLNVDLDNYMQLSNYGLGGHFRNHFDYVDLKGHSIIVPLMAKYHGDRFATVLFYLSNVELGGATIFPRLNLTIWPQRGAALLWYNLDNSVEPEKLSEHAVCPVIVGSRWVLAEFIVQYKQTFKRPCYK
ncbi:prolyl 4-hydroxylase subunit alpha-2-like [Scaptodrosophila lebanonensis]|uniref:procollagen-proline 4-dioxygenase n=1 Tax=Drosophila lebanonensis TaxID=7225 RepID=A0A6J2T7J1_DROLE|nr:prolyl 4-hydroxylase subunit alpha-2-like [Scaptodrosophila lebanonensis]